MLLAYDNNVVISIHTATGLLVYRPPPQILNRNLAALDCTPPMKLCDYASDDAMQFVCLFFLAMPAQCACLPPTGEGLEWRDQHTELFGGKEAEHPTKTTPLFQTLLSSVALIP